jgi:hypothetical protein
LRRRLHRRGARTTGEIGAGLGDGLGFRLGGLGPLIVLGLLWLYTVLVLGASHDRLARLIASFRRADVDAVDRGLDDDDDERKRLPVSDPWYWSILSGLTLLALTVMVPLSFAPPNVRCRGESRGVVRCEATRLHFGVLEHGKKTEVLPPVTTIFVEGDHVVWRTATKTLFLSWAEDPKLARVAAQKAQDLMVGPSGKLRLDVTDLPARPWDRFPWVALALMLPYVVTNIRLGLRAPKASAPDVDDDVPASPALSTEQYAGVSGAAPSSPALHTCPRDATSLVQGRGLLHENVCPTCRGRVLPPAAAHRVLVDELGLSIADLQVHAGVPGRRAITCPCCGAKMSLMTLKGAPTDLCRGCGALWLDAGELKRVSGRWDEV